MKDYKFFCFSGIVKFFKIDINRYSGHRANYFDRNFKLLPFGEVSCPPDFSIDVKMPENINEMIHTAEALSKNIPFVRIDLYNISGAIYFSEITFFPASGLGPFTKPEYDKIIGEYLTIKKD